jgi:arginase family enzyme
MRLLTICENSDDELAVYKVLKFIKKDELNEDGILPVFEQKDITSKSQITSSVKKSLEETDKTCIIAVSHSAETFKGLDSGIVMLCSSPPSLQAISDKKVILVGIRRWSAKEFKQLTDLKITYYSMKEISAEGLKEVSESIMSVAKNFKPLYLSIDLNVLDPSCAKGSDPGGLQTRELLYLVQRLKNLKSFRIADIVGIDANPEIAAKIVTELY